VIVGTDEDTGTAIPGWTYSTGFGLSSEPGVVNGMLVDASERVKVTVAKTVAGDVPVEARQYEIIPKDGQDEIWIPIGSDFRAYKFRFQFDGPNTAVVRRVMFSRDGIAAVGG